MRQNRKLPAETLNEMREEMGRVHGLVREQKYDAEFAQVTCGLDTWAYYETKGKGGYDLVLYSSQGGASKPDAAYVLDKSGKLAPRAKPVTCTNLAIPALFATAALRRDFAKIGPELLRQVADPKCRP